MKLSDIATIKIGLETANFWLVRRGSIEAVGKPTRSFNQEHIGLKVNQTNIILPDFLFWFMVNMHNQGVWKPYANGSLSLVNIRAKDVQNYRIG